MNKTWLDILRWLGTFSNFEATEKLIIFVVAFSNLWNERNEMNLSTPLTMIREREKIFQIFLLHFPNIRSICMRWSSIISKSLAVFFVLTICIIETCLTKRKMAFSNFIVARHSCRNEHWRKQHFKTSIIYWTIAWDSVPAQIKNCINNKFTWICKQNV